MTDSSRDDQILDQFRDWLRQTREESELQEGDQPLAPVSPSEPTFGLQRLVEEFTALRHELKLQTRSARGLEEQTDAVLTSMRQAIDALRSLAPREPPTNGSVDKSLVTALVDLDESLDRGRAQLEKVGVLLVEASPETLLDGLERLRAMQSWLSRWLTGRYQRQVLELVERDPGRRDRVALFEALRDGYTLIQQRLARALSNEGVARIPTVGQAVDPEQMMVVEVVESEGRPGVVVDEIRRGYTWNGRLLRYAEVRAARPRFDQQEP